MKSDIEIGCYLQKLRKERKMSLREVAEHVGIDISMLSKIEHGERQVQGHMLKSISEIFEIDYKKLCVNFYSNKLNESFGDSPFIIEAAKTWLSKIQ